MSAERKPEHDEPEENSDIPFITPEVLPSRGASAKGHFTGRPMSPSFAVLEDMLIERLSQDPRIQADLESGKLTPELLRMLARQMAEDMHLNDGPALDESMFDAEVRKPIIEPTEISPGDLRNEGSKGSQDKKSEKISTKQVGVVDYIWGLLELEPSEEEKKQFANWAAEVDLDSRFIGPPPSADSEVAARGLFGSLEQVALEAELRMSALESDPAGMRKYLQSVMPPTVQRLIRQETDPEKVVDLVMTLALKRRRAVTEQSRLLAWHLYHHLRKKKELNAGSFQTWAAIGDLVSGDQDPELRGEAVFYYEGMLHAVAESTFELDDRLLSGIEGASNNMCGAISRMSDAREVETADKVMNETHRISTIAARLRQQGGDEERAHAMWAGLGGLGDAQLGLPHIRMLANMMHMPISWRHASREAEEVSHGLLDSHLCMAVMETMAAAARIVLGRDVDEIVQTFFNAGVSLLRLSREGTPDERKHLLGSRIALNVAGLGWSLRQVNSAESLIRSLSKNHGMSCLVNMLGATSDSLGPMGNQSQLSRDALAGLVSSLSVVQKLGLPAAHAFNRDFFRIRMSMQQIGVDFPEPPDFAPELITKARECLLTASSHLIPWAHESLQKLMDTQQTATELGRVAAQFVRQTLSAVAGEKFDGYLQWVGRLLQGLEADAQRDIRQVIGETLARQQPSSLVVGRLVKAETWAELSSSLGKPPGESLDRFLYSFDWDFLG